MAPFFGFVLGDKVDVSLHLNTLHRSEPVGGELVLSGTELVGKFKQRFARLLLTTAESGVLGDSHGGQAANNKRLESHDELVGGVIRFGLT